MQEGISHRTRKRKTVKAQFSKSRTYRVTCIQLDAIDCGHVRKMLIGSLDGCPSIFTNTSGCYKAVVGDIESGTASNEAAGGDAVKVGWKAVTADKDISLQLQAQVLDHLRHGIVAQEFLFTGHGSAFVHDNGNDRTTLTVHHTGDGGSERE